MLHKIGVGVHEQGRQALAGDGGGGLEGIGRGVFGKTGYIRVAIRNNDDYRNKTFLLPELLFGHGVGQIQPVGQRSFATGGEDPKFFLGQDDAVGGGQQNPGPGAVEGDHGHPVPALVGLDQKGQRQLFGRGHASLGTHGAAGIYHQEKEGLGFPHPMFITQIGASDGPALPKKIWIAPRCGPESSIQGEVRVRRNG